MPATTHRKSLCRWFVAGTLATTAIFASWASLAVPPAGVVTAAEIGPRAFAPRPTNPMPHSTSQREREGTALVDVLGHFKLTGDRATFFPTGSDAHYVGLENQNLERIATAVSDMPEPPSWIVSGTLTEYRGANYLLVTKAILQNAPAGPGRAANSAEPSSLSELGRGF
jgi:hypothetical protein